MVHLQFHLQLLSFAYLCFYQASSTSVAKGCAADRKDAVKNARFRISHSMATMDSAMMSAWGGGGGPRGNIPANAGTPFAGREYGGGDRKHNIYGTRLYGSGYPYGGSSNSNVAATSVAGRGFPFGVWPISWGQNYLGGDEFNGLEILRPGGALGISTIATTDTSKWPGVDTSKEVYQMIGDKESLLFMMTDLVDHCHVTPQWPKAFDPTAANSTKPDNVMQYYRGSSFALTYSSFNNSISGKAWEPLPSPLGTSAFLHCVNDTIAAAVPLMDALPNKPLINGGAIAGIVIGGIVFFVLAFILGQVCIEHFRKKRQQTTDEDVLADENGNVANKKDDALIRDDNSSEKEEEEPKKEDSKKEDSKKEEPKKEEEENVIYQ